LISTPLPRKPQHPDLPMTGCSDGGLGRVVNNLRRAHRPGDQVFLAYDRFRSQGRAVAGKT
jgi:hypothetical protein